MKPKCGKCGEEKRCTPCGQWQCWPCSAARAKARYHRIIRDPVESKSHKSKWYAAVARWAKRNPVKIANYQKTCRDKVRKEVLINYGGDSPACACCAEKELDLLTIDHITPCGRKGRKKQGNGSALYHRLRKQAFPKGYRVLCMNCNFAIGVFGYCPHKGKQEPVVHDCPVKRSQQKTRAKRKLAALCAYGGTPPVCSCCRESHREFLTIDHENHSGAAHRKSIGSGGGVIYTWLRRNNYPKGFRVLCINCNHSIGVRGNCPHQSNCKSND